MGEEKTLLTLQQIEDKLSEIDKNKEKNDDEKTSEKKKFLRDIFTNKAYKSIKAPVARIYSDLLLKKSLDDFHLVYDSLSEGLEPIYYWILDFMRDSQPGGLGLTVYKGPEDFEASATSGYFGEIGQRSSLMQQKASDYLGAINQVIKSILNLIYDLKEFRLRLDLYNELTIPEKKEGALMSLKALWMDTVDSRKGRGSINLLAQDLQFATIRDAFFYIEKHDEQKIEKLDLDRRVKNILTVKLKEFEKWIGESEKELKKRYNIEKAYLKSQAGSLKLYAGWAKPYLIAAQKLKMKNWNNADIVNSFSNIEIKLSIVGKNEIKPDQSKIHPSYKNVKLDNQYFEVIEAVMDFRGVPSAVTTQGGRQYVHGGRAEIKFRAFVFDKVEMEAIEQRELYEDFHLIEEWVDVSLKELEAEIQDFLTEGKKEEKKEEKKEFKIDWPFKGTIDGFKEIFSPLTDTVGSFVKKNPPTKLIEEDLKKHAENKAKITVGILYTVYKKTHGMIAV